MKRLKFDNIDRVRFLCSKGEINRLIQEGRDLITIGVTPKGVIVEFVK